MDLVRGVPITRHCDENNLPIRDRLDLFVAVCQAIQHAHTKGIIHRDIKPSNVLVTRQDGQPVVKVIDFGIAKAMGQQLTDKTLFTEFAQMVGTPLYMSPEQAELSSVDIDTRSDIYSLGVLLYELLTGTTPVNREQLKQAAFDEVRRIIREEDPPKPSTRISSTAEAAPTIAAHRHTEPGKLAKMMRGELDWIAMKCLEKDRNRRYETANALAADVQHYLDDQPVQACPPSAAYRFRKFARRYKAALATAAAIGVAMLLAVASLIATVKIEWDSRARIYVEQQQTKSALGRETQANKKLQVALATEREQRVRAEHNMKLTLRSLGLVYDRTYGPTENAPLSREQRKLSLEKEVSLYEEFLRESSVDDSASLRVETASAYLRLGRLYLELERVAKAEAAYRAAVQQLERLRIRRRWKSNWSCRLATGG
jgi:hypothetical protein